MPLWPITRLGRRERHWFTDPIEMYLRSRPRDVRAIACALKKPEGGKGDFTIGKASRITPEWPRGRAREVGRMTVHRRLD